MFMAIFHIWCGATALRNSLRLIVLPAAVLGCLAVLSAPVLSQDTKPVIDKFGDPLETLDISKFSRPSAITNKWLPMKPGTRYIYEGTAAEDDGKVVPHRIVITITDLVKVIGGVRNIVSYDLD